MKRLSIVGGTLAVCAFLLWVGVQRTRGSHAVREIEAAGGAVGTSTSFFGHPRKITFLVPGQQASLDDLALCEIISRIRGIRYLDLTGTYTSSRGVRCLQEQQHLHTLILYDTCIDNEALATLQHMTQVQVLDLGKTAVNDDALATLVQMNWLEELRICGTALTDGAIEQIRQGLPRTQVLIHYRDCAVAPHVSEQP